MFFFCSRIDFWIFPVFKSTSRDLTCINSLYLNRGEDGNNFHVVSLNFPDLRSDLQSSDVSSREMFKRDELAAKTKAIKLYR